MKASNFFYHSTPITVNELIERNRVGKVAPRSRQFKKILSHLSQLFLPTNEPQVRQRVDRSGELIWTIYDPMTKAIMQFASETEVRTWLDQRYYS
jgi:hypothetical protein